MMCMCVCVGACVRMVSANILMCHVATYIISTHISALYRLVSYVVSIPFATLHFCHSLYLVLVGVATLPFTYLSIYPFAEFRFRKIK